MSMFLVVVHYLLLFLVVCSAEIQTFDKSFTISATPNAPDENRKLWNEIILTVVASLSAFGSIAIIVTYFLWRDLQTTARRILVYISIGDFFTVYPTLVIFWTKEYNKNGISCKVQSFVTSTAVMWSFFWTSSLAIYLYIAVVKKNHGVAEKLMVVFHMINWCVPALLLGAAWYEDHLGYTENKSTVDWCWIKVHSGDHRAETIWMLVCGKLWEIISYFINGALYFSVTRNIKRELSARHHLMSSQSVEIAQQGGKKLALVPVIFVALRIWGTIRFLIFAFSADIPNILNEILTTLQVSIPSS